MTPLLFAILLFQGPGGRRHFLDQSVASAREKIVRSPNRAEPYNDLALALTRKNRETGDSAFLKEAEQAVATSLKLEPANFEGRKARVAVRLRQKRYEDALEEAQALNKLTPDDNPIYGFISEAQIALGNYREAEAAVQRMMDLRPVNGPGMERGAIVREMIGYPDAALDWWNSALRLTSDRDTEARAFIDTQTARVNREMGKYDAAGSYAQQALTLQPEYPAALQELARTRIEQGKGAEAVALLQTRLKEGADLSSLYWLARAMEISGTPGKAPAAWTDFERQARAAVSQPDNANVLLIRYYVDTGKPQEGVAIGRETIQRRHDLFTLDAFAWALLRSGDAIEAKRQIQKALQPGMRNWELFYHAGMIMKAAGDDQEAARYLKQSLEVNASSPVAGQLFRELASTGKS